MGKKRGPYPAEVKEQIMSDFLVAYEKFGSIAKASAAVGVGDRTIDEWLRTNQEFADRLEFVRNRILGDLESEAIRRAKEGSDSLLMFMMKAIKPSVYNPSVAIKAEANSGNQTAKVIINLNRDILTDEEVAMLGQINQSDEGPTKLRTIGPAEDVPQE